MSPRLNWDSPTPSPKRECLLPPEPKGGGHTLLRVMHGVGESQFQRLEKKLSTLSSLWLDPYKRQQNKSGSYNTSLYAFFVMARYFVQAIVISTPEFFRQNLSRHRLWCIVLPFRSGFFVILQVLLVKYHNCEAF
jgi:hypothetical protein